MGVVSGGRWVWSDGQTVLGGSSDGQTVLGGCGQMDRLC